MGRNPARRTRDISSPVTDGSAFCFEYAQVVVELSRRLSVAQDASVGCSFRASGPRDHRARSGRGV